MIDIIASIFVFLGTFLYALGVLGLLRLPDALSRMHATTKSDTLAIILLFVGLGIGRGWTMALLTLILIVIFMWLTNPTAAHVIAKMHYLKELGGSDDPS
jgi:multicomponent Na+:H+ antiporter subunit G